MIPQNSFVFALKVILIFAIVAGNVLVLIVMIKGSRRRNTTRNYFVIAIAICDLIVGAFSTPFCLVSI